MSDTGSTDQRSETEAEVLTVLVRYWASARAAAGVDAEQVAVDGPVTLRDLVSRLAATHVAADAGTRMPQVLAACSVLVGDRPVKSLDPATVIVRPGDSVGFLPPFAGG